MKLRKLRSNNQAVLSFFLMFIFLAAIGVFLFSIGIPFTIDFSTELINAGDDIISNTINKVNDIDNPEIRERLTATLNNAQEAKSTNIEILSFFYQYAWVWIILLITFVIFIGVRKIVETNQMGIA